MKSHLGNKIGHRKKAPQTSFTVNLQSLFPTTLIVVCLYCYVVPMRITVQMSMYNKCFHCVGSGLELFPMSHKIQQIKPVIQKLRKRQKR